MKTHNLNVTGKHRSSKPPPSKTPLFHDSESHYSVCWMLVKNIQHTLLIWFIITRILCIKIVTRRTHAVVVLLEAE